MLFVDEILVNIYFVILLLPCKKTSQGKIAEKTLLQTYVLDLARRWWLVVALATGAASARAFVPKNIS